MTAIITCGETRQSLSAVRSLGRAGIPTAVCASRRPALAMWSRFANSTFLVPDPSHNAYSYAEQLAEELRGRYAMCALVGTDDALWALSRFRELLPISARRLLPPHYSVVRALDHEALHNFARSIGVPCAPLVRISPSSNEQEFLEEINGLTFPQLIRPIIPWSEREDGSRRKNARIVVYSRRHLKDLIKKKKELFLNGFLASAYQSMRALSYFGVCDRGEVLVEGFQERLNELEPYNEVGTLSITIDPIASLRKYSQELLAASQWQGPFKVEFIKDQRGNYRLISLIGRLWGSLQLSVAAGCNIPLISYRLAEGTLTKDLLKNARPNVRMRWLIGDAMAKVLKLGKLGYGLWHLSKDFSFSSYLSWFSPKNKITTCYDVLDLEDPMPFLFELQHKTWRRAFGDAK